MSSSSSPMGCFSCCHGEWADGLGGEERVLQWRTGKYPSERRETSRKMKYRRMKRAQRGHGGVRTLQRQGLLIERLPPSGWTCCHLERLFLWGPFDGHRTFPVDIFFFFFLPRLRTHKLEKKKILGNNNVFTEVVKMFGSERNVVLWRQSIAFVWQTPQREAIANEHSTTWKSTSEGQSLCCSPKALLPVRSLVGNEQEWTKFCRITQTGGAELQMRNYNWTAEQKREKDTREENAEKRVEVNRRQFLKKDRETMVFNKFFFQDFHTLSIFAVRRFEAKGDIKGNVLARPPPQIGRASCRERV